MYISEIFEDKFIAFERRVLIFLDFEKEISYFEFSVVFTMSFRRVSTLRHQK